MSQVLWIYGQTSMHCASDFKLLTATIAMLLISVVIGIHLAKSLKPSNYYVPVLSYDYSVDDDNLHPSFRCYYKNVKLPHDKEVILYYYCINNRYRKEN